MELLRKQIIAWADTQPEWQRDLLRRVAHARLDDDGRREVADIVVGAPGAPAPEPLRESQLPGDDPVGRPVSLLAIRDVQSVNALAPDQNLRFEPEGLTVVYGANGSGKSGFGRILRVVCRAVAVPRLLPNAFAQATGLQSARLKVRRGAEEEDLRLDLDAEPPAWLSAVKVFDSECAQEYVRSGNAVEHTPEPLGVLSRCADEQTAIAEILRTRAAAIATITEITATTDVGALVAGAALTVEEETELARLDAYLTTLDRRDLETVIAGARSSSAAATTLADGLEAVGGALGPSAATLLETLRADHAAAVAALEQLRRAALEGQPVAGTGTPAWRAMWESARAFVAKDFPPREGQPCPLCQRELDRETEARLERFEEFVTSDLEARVARAAQAVRDAVAALPDPQKLPLAATNELATISEELRGEVLDAVRALVARRNAIMAAEVPSGASVGGAVCALRARAEAEATRAMEHEKLRDPEERATLEAQVAGLRSRLATTDEAPALREKHAYLAGARRLDTSAITRRHNELAKLAISDRLVTAVQLELERLGVGLANRVEAAASGSKGRTVLRVRLKASSSKPGQVLSEGEHQGVAIAFFLAQVAESGGRSAIVLDDPVSSLDHLWRDEIATRLAREAARRQVIVLTHDLAFVAHLSAAATDAGVPFAQRHLMREGQRAGIVSNAPPFAHIAFSKRVEEMRRQVDQNLQPLWDHNRDLYNDRADKWIVELRKSWEMLVEEGLLRGVVRRYDARIYINKLKQLHIPAGAIAKIQAAFGRLSGKAHYEAAAAAGAPSPARLLELLAEFEELVNELRLKDADATDASEAAA
jgi:energy-coupling factor transporter ATP-binding protein EcfA2